ncbi:ankyrin repeat-containing domain protein, partial [Xylogone sp. PMI_703]
AFEMALKAGHKHVVQQLLGCGIDINLRFVEHHRLGGPTPLQWAAETGSLEQAQLFLNKGANANLFMYSYRTPLLIAAEKGNSSLVEILANK